MSKTKIVLASVLKPINDTRMYEKIGISLSQTKKYEINIIGFWVKKKPKFNSSLKLFPVFKFERLTFGRLLAPITCFKKYLQVNPQLIIINTHELLIVTVAYKIIFGSKIVYDVQENYYRNILFGSNFPGIIRPLLAGYVRLKEWMTRPWIDHYLLAERAYQEEFHFTRGKYTVIENKYKPATRISAPVRSPKKMTLLFSGTLSETTGVFEAIRLSKKLYQLDDTIRLIIIGFCAHTGTRRKLKMEVQGHPFIELIGGDYMVPHNEIVDYIQRSNFGIISYPKNKSTVNAIPTKLYEYLALQLPILLQHHRGWESICASYKACLAMNFDTVNERVILEKMKTTTFYTQVPKEEVLWGFEEKKLIQLMDFLLT
ncbi:glycosyltransferase family 4 protein [Fulvivirga sp. M361]|uniref:glycosyltransferase family 4 protein n=1 Tax=Fulvivirga sp. M361 TaxID=2594266 RepID=UPI0011799A8B|nr:glycosyltransferase family 4 protein [Fulvivirga sp. M361]TRX50678.1 glycosyltransferase family 4 protein [Fulvivirga sp. M361]